MAAKCVIGPNCPNHHGGGSRSRDTAGPQERAVHKSPRRSRPGWSVDADQFAIAVSELNAAAQRLANTHEASTRPRVDGRQVIEDGKRERRKLITRVLRGGINAL